MRQDLVEAAQHGDHEAFRALAVRTSPRLYALARGVLHDTGLAEDAVQEALVDIWRKLPTLRDPARFDAWACRLLINAATDIGRERRRLTAHVRVMVPPDTVSDTSTEFADRERLERGFRLLRPEQRAAVVLHYYLGFSAREIAEALGVPVGTAKSKLHYATEILRGALEADERPARAAGRGISA